MGGVSRSFSVASRKAVWACFFPPPGETGGIRLATVMLVRTYGCLWCADTTHPPSLPPSLPPHSSLSFPLHFSYVSEILSFSLFPFL